MEAGPEGGAVGTEAGGSGVEKEDGGDVSVDGGTADVEDAGYLGLADVHLEHDVETDVFLSRGEGGEVALDPGVAEVSTETDIGRGALEGGCLCNML